MLDRSVRWTDYAPALVLAGFAFFGVSAAQLFQGVGSSIATLPQVAVVFPPWVEMGEALARVTQADGRLVRLGFFGNVIIAAPNDERFVERLYQQGGVLVVDPIVFGGCSVEGGQSPETAVRARFDDI